MIHLDTSFLVDLLREGVREKRGPANAFLLTAADQELWASVFVACELLAGAELSPRPRDERRRVEEILAAMQIARPDERFAGVYAKLLAWLERRGQRISTMDLLIATSAVGAGAALVTRNARDFSRVPGLEVLSY